jgi:phosphoglycerate dehydrogenase-like enzyme
LQEIGGSRLGLVGIGNIGLQVAKIAGLLGASVSYYMFHFPKPAQNSCLR